MNPCSVFGLTLDKGVEYLAATLVMAKLANALGVLSIWSVVIISGLDLGFDLTRMPGLKTLEEKILFIFAEACISFLIDWFLLIGVWHNNRAMCDSWMWLRAIQGLRVALLGKPLPLKTTIFDLSVQFYEYWVVACYEDELEEEFIQGYLRVRPLPIYINIISILLCSFQFYVIFYNPIVDLPPFSLMPFLHP